MVKFSYEDDFMNDTFVVFNEDTGAIMGIYSELVDAYDRTNELEAKGMNCSIEAYTLDQDVDYEDDDAQTDENGYYVKEVD